MKRIFFAILATTALTTATASAATTGETDKSETTNTEYGKGNLLRAALKGWHVRLGAGFNIGGTSPLPLPREIRKIEGYHPHTNISLSANAQKQFDDDWGISVGVRFESKGMETDARVKNYHMEAVNDDGSGRVVGAWTGHVKTKVDNIYLTFPVLATYTISDRWQVSAGPYFSYLLHGSFSGNAYDGYLRDQDPTGEKAEVASASYDFSGDLRRFQWGLQVGGEFKAYKHLAVNAHLTWGLNGIFPKDFEAVTFSLYPIYANVGFSYIF